MELKNFFAQDTKGNVVPFATVTVYNQGTTVRPTIYGANGSAITNPFNVGNTGLAQFRAANGEYDVKVITNDGEYTLTMQCNDVNDSIDAAAAEADRAQSLVDDFEADGSGINVNTATGAQTLAAALDQRGPVFDSVADMKAETGLAVGVKVRTLGYYTPGDGGGSDYEIVAAGTGTDDGGSVINLSGSGTQAFGEFTDCVNIKQFGARANNTDDCSESLKNAIVYATKFAESPTVYIPTGRYRMFSKVEHTSLTGVVYRLNIKGDGPENSRLVFDESLADAGINIEMPGNAYTCHVEGVGFFATNTNQGTALRITQPGTGDQIKRSVHIENCRVAPYPDSLGNPNGNGCFNKGFVVNGAYFPLFHNVFVASPWGPSSNGEIVDYGIDVSGCYSPKIVLSQLQNVGYGIYNPETIDGRETRAESMAVYSTIILCRDAGIVFERSSTMFEPQLEVVGGHINYVEEGIRCSRIHHVKINGLLFYNTEGSTVSSPADIRLFRCNSGSIGGNIFTAGTDSSGNRIGIDLDRCYGFSISSNVFSGGMLYAVQTSSEGCFNNRVDGSNTYTDRIPGTTLPGVQNKLNDRAKTTTLTYDEESSGSNYTVLETSRQGSSSSGHRYYKSSTDISPGDAIGRVIGTAKNSAGEDYDYTQISHIAKATEDGAEQGELAFFTNIQRQMTIDNGVALGTLLTHGAGTLNASKYYALGQGGADGTFTSSDGKTITVSGGIITSIV